MSTNNGVKYTLEFVNNSSNAGSMMVFQKDPQIGVPNVQSLAWFSKYTYPNTRGFFRWNIDYNFVWAETGELKPGVMFYATQDPEANLTTKNAITLTHNRAYNFVDQRAEVPSGSLYIKQDQSIPLKQAAVGIGMSGSGTFVVQAQPNWNETFTPKPQYWLAFGNYTKGEVLDITSVTNDVHISFPPGVFSMTAILGKDNKWTVRPTRQNNELMIAEAQA